MCLNIFLKKILTRDTTNHFLKIIKDRNKFLSRNGNCTIFILAIHVCTLSFVFTHISLKNALILFFY